jgi:hypothetical protein
MKLRLLGNAVRLRLAKSEVEQLVEVGIVEESVDFLPKPLVYIILASQDGSQIEATFLNGWITISVPEKAIHEWASGNEVGMKGTFRGVSVLIEKDWSCMHGEEGENQDRFARPPH